MKFTKKILKTNEYSKKTGRYYSHILIERAVHYYQDKIKEKKSFGLLFRNDKDTTRFACGSIYALENVSHIVTEMWLDSNDLTCTIETLITPPGLELVNRSKLSLPFEFYLVGKGSLSETNSVMEDYEILGVDVCYP